MDKIPKEAICIRNSSSWAHVKPEHKFDSPKFNRDMVLADLPEMSPKMDALLNKIRQLDDEDAKVYGRYYKHIIYSDVGGVNGAKMVASALIANGFTLVYNNGLALKNDGLERSMTFGLLTTSTVYKKPLPVGLKKKMMLRMNERPNNVYGDNMRIIVLDPGFKEGIDVFDVKYMHMLEPLVTKAEQTQVIGRGTRYCGQAGLPFLPNRGWPMQVYRYNMMYDTNTNVHELYLKYSNQNISALNFIADLEDLVITSAVDLPLTENIHMLDKKNNRFYNMVKKIKDSLNKPPPAPVKPVRKDFIRIVSNIRGKIYTNETRIDCRQRCKGPLEEAPRGILLLAAMHVGHKDLMKALNQKFAKPLLCNYIDKMPEFCATINRIWLSPIQFIKVYKAKLMDNLEYYRRAYMIHEDNYKTIRSFIRSYVPDEKKPDVKPAVVYPAVPPPYRLNYLDLHAYVEKHFARFKWDELEVKNKCLPENQDAGEQRPKSYELVKFTKTQGFVQNFLTPQSPFKGMFLYHSVGSGKTCTAIATATNTFDKQGYTILWVTRHTLKEDIWKNMFDKICNVVLQDKIRQGMRLPASRAERMRLLGNNWLQPISYKQFTNLIKGRNKYYQEMVSRNGKEDPFRKTLVIIDEIHKIYSNTLSSLEKPNPEVLQKMIQNSFEKSGHNSLKLLLMTATPITEDPMSCIKIINLLLPTAQQFPEDFEKFKSQYCQSNGLFTDQGVMTFLNRTSGLVSYIDRSADKSQFAYPIIEDIMLKPNIKDRSYNTIKALQQQIEELQNKINTTDKKVVSKEELKEMKESLKAMKKRMTALHKANNEPNNVVDYINNCFTKGKKIKQTRNSLRSFDDDDISNKGHVSKEPKERKAKDPKEPKVPKVPKEPKVPKVPKEKKAKEPKAPKVCPEGKILNLATGRCINDPSLKKKK